MQHKTSFISSNKSHVLMHRHRPWSEMSNSNVPVLLLFLLPFIVESICASVSPSPSMMEVFVRMEDLTSLACRRTARDWSKLARGSRTCLRPKWHERRSHKHKKKHFTNQHWYFVEWPITTIHQSLCGEVYKSENVSALCCWKIILHPKTKQDFDPEGQNTPSCGGRVLPCCNTNMTSFSFKEMENKNKSPIFFSVLCLVGMYKVS